MNGYLRHTPTLPILSLVDDQLGWLIISICKGDLFAFIDFPEEQVK